MIKVIFKTVPILLLFSVFFSIGCKDKDTNKPPTCSIISPQNNAEFTIDELIVVTAIAGDEDGYVVGVQFYVDDVGYGFKTEIPYSFVLDAGTLSIGKHTLKAVAIDNKDAKTESVFVEIIIKEPPLKVGDHYQGGIIAYIDETGEHGFIAAPEDQSTNIKWWNGSYIYTEAYDTAIGTGQSNTTTIIKAQGDGLYAATLCDNLLLNGYDDWFLPSRDELHILYENRNLIGGFTNGCYWSSSDVKHANAYACGHDFGNGGQAGYIKSYTFYVRAVRYF